jgi:23S rRNA (uridine2552-2'-O)-methyltransferase
MPQDIKPKKNKMVKAWVKRHISDHYVHQAKQDGYRSRAAYKLLEIDAKYKIFSEVTTVIDLGCAPGSWSQVALKKITASGKVVGVDLLLMKPLDKLIFIQGDFGEEEVFAKLLGAINNKPVDLIISDIAPNLSGIKMVDQARCAGLVELVLDFATNYLRQGGNCLIKVFQGAEFNSLVILARSIFNTVVQLKPEASRGESSEMYLLGLTKKT